MRQFFIGAILLLLGAASWAQSYDPAVAYVAVASRTTTIYLANQDGTKAVPIYSVSKKPIGRVDFAPGGGKIVFSEQSALKLLSYTVSSSGISVSSIVTLDTGSTSEAAFSPDGSKILYSKYTTSNEIRLISASGGASTVLMTNVSGLNGLSWLSSGDKFAYYKHRLSDMGYEVRLATLDGSNNIVSDDLLFATDTQVFKVISGLDSARTRNSLLITANYATDIRLLEYDLNTNTFTDLLSGTNGHFSSDDSKIIHLDLNRNYVRSYSVSSGTSVNLTKKGAYNNCDARP